MHRESDGGNNMRFQQYMFSLLLGSVLFTYAGGCNPRSKEETARNLKDTSLENYQVELLNIAFEAASAMPANPHIKSRSQMQEVVVMACLDLGQPKRALGYIEQISNWRRGMCYAELALYCAKHDYKNQAKQFSDLAIEISQETEEWRKDQIKSKISKTHALLRQNHEASESENMSQIEAMTFPVDSFDKEMEELEKLVSTNNFDVIRSALGEYIELYNRFYTNIERRALIDEKIKASWATMPISIRIDFLMELIDCSLTHKDKPKALELVNEAEAMMDSATWQFRYEIPLMAGLAEFRFLADEKESAKRQIQEALNLFDTNRNKIVNIYRARMLRSIAETYQTMGETTIAHDLYKRVLEAGIENPNSRPRAEDLAATCCSMALHKVDPGVELSGRIHEICDSLGEPW
jgi:hypothetical protein